MWITDKLKEWLRLNSKPVSMKVTLVEPEEVPEGHKDIWNMEYRSPNEIWSIPHSQPIYEYGSRWPVGFLTSGSSCSFGFEPQPSIITVREEPTLLRKEWKCEFCGAVHPYEELDKNGHPHHVGVCSQCGHPKTVVQMASVK